MRIPLLDDVRVTVRRVVVPSSVADDGVSVGGVACIRVGATATFECGDRQGVVSAGGDADDVIVLSADERALPLAADSLKFVGDSLTYGTWVATRTGFGTRTITGATACPIDPYPCGLAYRTKEWMHVAQQTSAAQTFYNYGYDDKMVVHASICPYFPSDDYGAFPQCFFMPHNTPMLTGAQANAIRYTPAGETSVLVLYLGVNDAYVDNYLCTGRANYSYCGANFNQPATGDPYRWQGAALFEADYRRVLGYFPNASHALCVTPYQPLLATSCGAYGGHCPEFVDDVRTVVAAVARSGACTLVNLTEVDALGAASAYQSDSLHLSKTGEAAIARKIWHELYRALVPLPPPAAPPPAAPPPAVCGGWCAGNPNTWAYKCANFANCQGCTQCAR